MRLVVKSPVWEDLFRIASRIQKDDPIAANRFLDAAKKSFNLLTKFPEIGRMRSFSQPGIRSWAITHFDNYLIFYLPTREEVQVLAVMHGAMDFSAQLEERL